MASKTIGEHWHALLVILGIEPEVAAAGLIVAPVAEPEKVIVVVPSRKPRKSRKVAAKKRRRVRN